MLCSGAVGKGQAGVCTQKQRQVESGGRKHKSTVFLWDKINTVCLKLNDNPSWCFPWSIWICLYHVNLIGPSFITCSQSGIWVLNQEVDFNLDLNWGLRSNLTRRFFIPFSPYQSGCKCSLAVTHYFCQVHILEQGRLWLEHWKDGLPGHRQPLA